MRRALSLYFATWSIDLVTRRDRPPRSPDRRSPAGRLEEPSPRYGESPPESRAISALLLVGGGGGRQVVRRRCERAAAAGVRSGMSVAHARALLAKGAVRVELYAPHREAAALCAMAGWARRFSPIVATDPPDGLLLDITGCQRLFGGERRLVDTVAEADRKSVV